MTYDETLAYLYNAAPLFQHIGAGAYKEGLDTTRTLDAHFGHPHRFYRTLHVAGTNGKGSTAHTLAAFLMNLGFKVGLYTSPHLVDFRERIRVNGEPIAQERVVRFVEEERAFFEPLHPSFFELTTALALLYFKEQKVDYAVIEVGLGGRLDCTNIIRPTLSIITNISSDHTQFLGTTLAEIAAEKAGIIKASVPVVIGEALAETRPVFEAVAEKIGAPIIFAEDAPEVLQTTDAEDAETLRPLKRYATQSFGEIVSELAADCQAKNANTILTAIKLLAGVEAEIGAKKQLQAAAGEAFLHGCELTGLMGRWQMLSREPMLICDTGHNIGGWQYLAKQLARAAESRTVRIVFGMMRDKDVDAVLSLLPRNAVYYFTRAAVSRSMPEDEMAAHAQRHHLRPAGTYPSAFTAAEAALAEAAPTDFIFIGGSSFIVADFLAGWMKAGK